MSFSMLKLKSIALAAAFAGLSGGLRHEVPK